MITCQILFRSQRGKVSRYSFFDKELIKKNHESNNKMNYSEFFSKNENNLICYWNDIKQDILNWKEGYEWPKNVRLVQALALRDNLEVLINKDLDKYGYISKEVFDKVLKWGFRTGSKNSEHEILTCTMKAIRYLKQDNIVKASLELTSMRGIGISRASKILALSNQTNFGIYDSRSAHGLSDFTFCDNTRLPIPPGRKITGDNHLNNYDFCYGYQLYTWVIRYFRDSAVRDPKLKKYFARVSDIEIAFFSRSRIGLHINNNSDQTFFINSIKGLNTAFDNFQALIQVQVEDEEWRANYKHAVAEVKNACRSVLDNEVTDSFKEAYLLMKKASENLSIAMDFVEDLDNIDLEDMKISRRFMEKYLENMICVLRKLER